MSKFKLGEVCKLVGGGTPSKANSKFYRGDIPWATVRDMNSRWLESTEHSITHEAVNQSSTNVIPAGNVVVATRVGLGKVVQLKQDTAINQDLRALIPIDRTRINANYLFYWAQSVRSEIIAAGKGATVQGVTLPFMQNLVIPLTSLERQREIVMKLDKAFSEFGALESDLLGRKRRSISSLFDIYRDETLRSIGNTISFAPLGEVGEFVRGPFGGSLRKSIFKKTGVAIYEQQHAIRDQFTDFRYFIDDVKFSEMKRFEVKPNDLIMSCSGTYGKIAVVPEGSPKGIINQALLKISPKREVHPRYLRHWMQSSLFQAELEKGIGGAALQNVPSVAIMKRILVKIPSMSEQLFIVSKFEEVEHEVKNALRSHDQMSGLYIELRESFLQAAFCSEEL